ncbi:aminotransferase class I/II-fold pyridoxal phosphate-dependent enzyme [Crossiella sp. CA-258035]|uniref:pyridoxal phosphate-dependent aminotransferase n=1 Tax=Crossiella sp. CA-258035 TaxID=2981138 RepID=UPI0024BC99E4|nr:aminotransferase class I/II-fold pyridoxal phosphate-dependent enzyme [Crossiella sp. CA-258035]WHT20357.1 aminotransferase class I/II-fold pyridoxal phosphate-dependent enzyme [Crossiella sp. CA-258035]
MLTQSATLAANERIQALRAGGVPVTHLAFGEAGLPVAPEIAAALAAAAGRNSYGPTAGIPELRAAAAGYFQRRGLPTTPEQVVAGPGSKPLLHALLSVLPGDVVLPRPSWVSYAAQASLLGKEVVWVPVPEGSGGVPDPALLGPALVAARARGLRPGVLVLTLPDNPTGALAGHDTVRAVCEIAAEHGLMVISDEIYRDLAHEPGSVLSPAEIIPEWTVVTTGLSKATALGGWRLGVCRTPSQELTARLVGVASEIWSNPSTPVQVAAAYVLSEPEPVRAFVAAGLGLHRAVVRAAHQAVVAAGASCPVPGGGFYLYPDLAAARSRASGATELAELLLQRYRIGVLPGSAFGDDPRGLRFRLATSLLYGDTDEQRWTALRSTDPATLPWIAEPLARLGAAVAELTGKGHGDLR